MIWKILIFLRYSQMRQYFNREFQDPESHSKPSQLMQVFVQAYTKGTRKLYQSITSSRQHTTGTQQRTFWILYLGDLMDEVAGSDRCLLKIFTAA